MSQKLQKLILERTGNQLNFGFDIQKASDDTQRMVVGFATLDNLDQTGDIVLASASENAFRTFRGNIREQHNRDSAVGRLVAFEPATYYDPATQVMHKGIRVAVRISNGAESTWQKCLDGTYSGFSIKGGILDSEQIVKDGQPIKVIKQYHLTELSIVDNPANELANFETVYKALDGEQPVELEKDLKTKNLFWCAEHKLASQSADDRLPCAQCGEIMAIVGTITSDEDFTEKIMKVLDDLEINKEGVTHMADTIEKTDEEKDKVEVTPTDEAKETETSEVDKEAESDEEADEDAAPAVDVKALMAEINASLKLVEDTLVTKYNELSTRVDGALEKITTANSELEKRLGEQDDRLKEVAGATAQRKSQDAEVVEKGTDQAKDAWDGIFTGTFNVTT